MELKTLDTTKPSFIANGTEYFFETRLGITRFCEFQILEKELAYAMTFKSMHKKHWEMWELLNQLKFAELAVILNNLLNGNVKLEEMEPTALKICSLFINTKDEDRTSWNADLCSKKVNDWKIEGYDMQDFFRLALGTVDGYADIYKEMSRRISPMTNQEENEAE